MTSAITSDSSDAWSGAALLHNPVFMSGMESMQTTLQNSDASAANIGNPNYDPNSADADPTHPSNG